jgi:hypothetical protein
MKRLFALLASAWMFVPIFSANAQLVPGSMSYHEQALMFSNYEYRGSARIQALGNTQISLGGDISAALANPAGLGFYNRSELSLTPAVNSFEADSRYLGESTSSATSIFNIDNLGMVFNKTKEDYEQGKWRGGSFAISYSKINKFNSDIRYQGENVSNDILDHYVQQANEQNVDPQVLTGVTYGAFQSYLLSEFLDAFVEGRDTTYIPFYERTFFGEFPGEDFPTRQSEQITTSGSQNQWNFSYGGNYDDLIYVGFTIGIQTLRHNITKTYFEQYPGATNDIVRNSVLTEELQTEGLGLNATFGMIARPIQNMTIGFSVISPTWLSLSERYRYRTEANYERFDFTNYGNYFDANYDIIANPGASFTTFYESSDVIEQQFFEDDEIFFDYNIRTPWRLNGGATFFVNKNGFISADIEYVDYATINLSGEGGSLQNENIAVSDFYSAAINYRVGAEWRIGKFRVRGGYQSRGNPYKDSIAKLSSDTYSGGFGLRTAKFAVDLAASQRVFKSSYSPYTLNNPDGNPIFETSDVAIDNADTNLILTFSLFF